MPDLLLLLTMINGPAPLTFYVISMPEARPSGIGPVAACVFFLACLVIVAVFAFLQGKASAQRRAEIQVANDDAFYSLHALKALKEPQSEKWQTLFQVSLDGSALKLSDMCLSRPELIGNTNYNLLIQIERYLNEHGRAPDRIPSLKPVEQVTAKVHAAVAKLESIHPNVDRWEAEESRRAEISVPSK
jgi:hypothetical protein